MRTHILELDHYQSPVEIAGFMEEHQLEKGDVLKVITAEEKEMMQTIILMLIVLGLFYWFRQKRKRESDGEKILEDLFKGKSAEEIERQAEEEYGVKVEVEVRVKDIEEKEWRDFSVQNFLRQYGNEEPEYTREDVREPNPVYRTWKKEK